VCQEPRINGDRLIALVTKSGEEMQWDASESGTWSSYRPGFTGSAPAETAPTSGSAQAGHPAPAERPIGLPAPVPTSAMIKHREARSTAAA